MPRRRKGDETARFARRYAPAVVADLAVLRATNARLVDAALIALDDLAFGRQVGKLLGERHVTGDLTGLSRLRFDLPGRRPLRFRIVYRVADDKSSDATGGLPVIEVLAIGERADLVVYRDTFARLDPTDDTEQTGGDSDGDGSDEEAGE